MKIFPALTFALAATALAATSVFLVAADDGAAANTLSDAEKQVGWKLLFNGKDTSHFRNYQAEGVKEQWQVKDGVLTLTGKGGGDIITREKYGAFEMTLDYRISPAGNSGLMYHVTEEEKRPWQTGPEIQIQDNVDGHDPQKAGWLYQFYAADKDTTKPAGEWNTLRILITPEKCVHWMNGEKYVEYVKGSEEWNAKLAASKFSKFPKFGKATEGHICLQDHGNVVSFRNIKIREVK
jgi:hypothetical protein